MESAFVDVEHAVRAADIEADSATGGVNYTPVTGTLTFAPGETTGTFNVPILDNTDITGNLTLQLTLSNPVNATLGLQAMAGLIILDDEPEAYLAYLPFVIKNDNPQP